MFLCSCTRVVLIGYKLWRKATSSNPVLDLMFIRLSPGLSSSQSNAHMSFAVTICAIVEWHKMQLSEAFDVLAQNAFLYHTGPCVF